jgi:threonine/homoserine/homoserine lactone efflux protein
MPLLLEGIVLGLSVAAPIGPTNIEMIRRGLKGGFWSYVLFAAGVEVALVAYLVAILGGLSFLTEVELFNIILSAFGILVLLYMGVELTTKPFGHLLPDFLGGERARRKTMSTHLWRIK